MDPLIVKRSDHCVSRNDVSPNALKVLYRLRTQGYKGYLAGGCVRDLLLGGHPKDFDVATDATPEQVRASFRNCRLIGRRFRLAHVQFGPEIIEVATFRSGGEPDAKSIAAGHVVLEDGLITRDNRFGTAEEDARRRDFTVNALFYDIADFSIIDYLGAIEDLKRRVMHCIGEPDVRYREDPVRMIRAVRFAASLDFDIEEATYQGLIDNRDQLALCSNARLYDEILKILYSGAAEKAFDLMGETGMLEVLFPDWSEWLINGSTDADRKWVQAALAHIDRWKAHGHRVPPALIWSFLFGSYYRALMQRGVERELRPQEALVEAVAQHQRAMAERVLLPRREMENITHILCSQQRFQKTEGKQPHRFAQRPFFHDATVFFKFASRQSGENAQLVEWWSTFLKEEAPKFTPEPRTRPRRRRRRPPRKAEG